MRVPVIRSGSHKIISLSSTAEQKTINTLRITGCTNHPDSAVMHIRLDCNDPPLLVQLPDFSKLNDGNYLGEGSGGIVKQALSGSGEKIAVKKVECPRPDQQSRFKEELRLHRECTDGNAGVIRCLGGGFDASGKTAYLFLELAQKRHVNPAVLFNDLMAIQPDDQILQSHCLLVKQIFGQLLPQILWLHTHGIIHRDLKWENVFVTSENTYKLGDFGIAFDSRTENYTEKKEIAGTPGYMAPEIKEKKGCSTASDIWSLGVMLGLSFIPYCDPTLFYTDIAKSPKVIRLVAQVPAAMELCLKMVNEYPDNRPPIQEVISHRFWKEA